MFRLFRANPQHFYHSRRALTPTLHPTGQLPSFGAQQIIDKFIQNHLRDYSTMTDDNTKNLDITTNETSISTPTGVDAKPANQQSEATTNPETDKKASNINQVINEKSNKRKRNEEWKKNMRKASAAKKKNMRPGEWKSRNDGEKDEVHSGSFANIEMRKMFNVSIPELDKIDNNPSSTKDSEGEDVNSNAKDNQEQIKHPKRKVALLLGFLGTNYGGMQINKDQRSLQAEIELALFRAGVISKANFGFPKKYSWSNSARTDKGVHSCAQVCSAKILVPNSDYEVVRKMINTHLPDDIIVADVVKVPRTFCARTQRNKVRYQYMLPSFALLSCDEVKSHFASVLGPDNWRERPVKDPFTTEEANAIREKLRKYRAPDDVLNKLRSALDVFAGTHKFHNYTNGKTFNDANAQRYIHSFTVQEKVVDKSGVEWISTLVEGQSFLLHQIRKMMSMAMDAARGASSTEIIVTSLSDKYMNINTAPAQGLFLDMSYYEHFNKKQNQGSPKLDWHSDENSPAHLRWKKFKEESVMVHIMDEEEAQGNFIAYLFAQDNHIGHENYVASDKKKIT